MGTTIGPICGSRNSLASRRTKAIVVETSWPPVPSWNSANILGSGGGDRLDLDAALRQVAAQGAPPLVQVFHLGAVVRPACKTAACDTSSSLIGMPKRVRNSRSSSSLSFFCWWVMLRPLAGFAQAVTFDRFGQDHRRRAGVPGGGMKGRVNFFGVVARRGAVCAPVRRFRCSNSLRSSGYFPKK